MIKVTLPFETPKPDFILTIKEMSDFFDHVDEIMSEKIDAGNGGIIAEKLADVAAWYAYSSQVCASAKWYHAKVYEYHYERIVGVLKKRKLNPETAKLTSASNLKEYIKNKCADFIYLVERADRTNRGMTHYCDSLRTLISKLKSEREIAKYMRG